MVRVQKIISGMATTTGVGEGFISESTRFPGKVRVRVRVRVRIRAGWD
jgi:DsbC/DsbD-like thiol-disulfide interchange protein